MTNFKIKQLIGICLVGALFNLGSVAFAEVDMNGFVELDERISLDGSGDINWNRVTLGLKTRAELSEQVSGYGELKLETLDAPTVSQGADLSEIDKVYPLQIQLYEAYLDLNGFPLQNMDVRAGKQRIAWGTADKLNPTDNLNPYDFTDLLEFGEKIPTNALKLTTYLGDTTFTSAVVPVFTPAVMPATYNASLTAYLATLLPAGLTLATVESNVVLPDHKTNSSLYGVKLSRNIFGNDMSLSYFSGYDSVPNIANIVLTAVSTTQVTGSITQNYPKIQVIGYDLAGDFRGIGYWAEFAFVKPIDLTQTIVNPITGTTTIKIGDYTKYTIGGDYTFDNGVYFNSQFMHGFFDERGENLTDLLMTGIEKKFFDEKLKLALIWAGELKFSEGKKLIGNLFGPQTVFYPVDATEIELGIFSIDGDLGSKLETLETLDQVYLKFKYSF